MQKSYFEAFRENLVPRKFQTIQYTVPNDHCIRVWLPAGYFNNHFCTYVTFPTIQVSVTFDPFSCLAVPLPKKMRLISVILFTKDPTVTPVKVI